MGKKTVEITDANFQEIINSGKTVLIDFWAAWCGPCLMIAPIIEQIAEEVGEEVIVGKMDVDANPQTSISLGIRSIPTLMVFKNGQLKAKQVGVVPKATIMKMLNA